ncbi:recombinase family protein [Gordonia tangerina]|uniref:Recombinase family protein n=1 Tax=Gordonia tangerina TaxID=2911060 RepID=A0ABS9DDG7_9ACTN|nr:recombinase family protein [Gordonia tangerina]MCF3937168.1 recombinase family protein [Gordonia tangerina]
MRGKTPVQEPKRALIVTRLSRVTDATTSLERQREKCEERCVAEGYEVVGYAEDGDTSGSISPFERKRLGSWLRRPHSFDVIMCWKLDRFTRSASDFWHFWEWTKNLATAENHRIELVTVTDKIDTTTAMGRGFAGVIASLGEAELESISIRNRNAFRYNFTRGKWRGGVAPWGYVPEVIDGEWRLVQDPAQCAVIREVVDRVMAGEGLSAIARDLTARKVPTAKDAFSLHRGQPARGFEWHVSPLRRALRSETLRGWVVTKGEVIRDASGKPRERAEPIIKGGEWRRLQARLDATARASNSRQPQSLLTGAIRCAVCGDPMWILRGGSAGRVDRYRCKSANSVAPCDNRTIVAGDADEMYLTYVEPVMDQRVTRREWRSGVDRRDDVADLDEQITDLVRLLGRGEYRAGTIARAALDQNISALSAERDELAAEPVVEAGYVEVEGEGTLRDKWAEWSPEERNQWVRTGPILFIDARDRDDLGVLWVMGWTADELGVMRRAPDDEMEAERLRYITERNYRLGEVPLADLARAWGVPEREAWSRLRWSGFRPWQHEQGVTDDALTIDHYRAYPVERSGLHENDWRRFRHIQAPI